jgi:hypothetical protein
VGRRIRRNAKGHFVKRSRTTRRSRRRNPSGFVKVGRRWKKITKYAVRRRRGARRGQIRRFKFPRRMRRVRRNPVVVSNPPRRHRRRIRRNPYRSHRRHVRRNPAVAYRLSSDPIGAIKNAIMSAFSMDTFETLFHMGLGFGGSIAISKTLIAKFSPDVLGASAMGRVGGTFATTIALTVLSSFFKNPAMTARMLTGGLFATAWQGLSEAIADKPDIKAYIPTLSGPPETDEFRKAIEREVLKELKGGVHGYLPAAGAEGYSTYLRPAGIEYLRPAGAEAYLTRVNSERAQDGMGAFLTERETSRVDSHPAGVGGDEGEFSRESMPERF